MSYKRYIRTIAESAKIIIKFHSTQMRLNEAKLREKGEVEPYESPEIDLDNLDNAIKRVSAARKALMIVSKMPQNERSVRNVDILQKLQEIAEHMVYVVQDMQSSYRYAAGNKGMGIANRLSPDYYNADTNRDRAGHRSSVTTTKNKERGEGIRARKGIERTARFS